MSRFGKPYDWDLRSRLRLRRPGESPTDPKPPPGQPNYGKSYSKRPSHSYGENYRDPPRGRGRNNGQYTPPAFVSVGTPVEGGNSINPAYPSGVEAGRTAFLIGQNNHAGGEAFWTSPSGFVRVCDVSPANIGRPMTVWKRTLDGTETGTVNIDNNGGGTPSRQQAVIFIYEGLADDPVLLPVANADSNEIVGPSLSVPSGVLAGNSDDLVALMIVGGLGALSPITPPSGWTERLDNFSDTGAATNSLAVYEKALTDIVGETGKIPSTTTGSWAALVFLLRPIGRFTEPSFTDLGLTNGDAETGDTTGWSLSVGVNFAVSGGLTNRFPNGGTYAFIASTNGNVQVIDADAVDIPGGFTDAVDDGNAELKVSYLHASFSDGDWGCCRVQFYDAVSGGGNLIGVKHGLHNGGGWISTPYNRLVMIPPGTRSVVFSLICDRTSGTENSFYFDDVTLGIRDTSRNCEILYVDDGTDITGWTVTTGSGQPQTTGAWSPWGFDNIYGQDGTAYACNKEITPSSAALTAIAAGGVKLFLDRIAWNENGDDRSRTYVECLDSGDSVLATLEDAASATNWGTAIDFMSDGDKPDQLEVPTGTVKFRYGHDFERADGTVIDAGIGFVDVRLEW